MSKIYLNEHQLQLLEANPNVASVSEEPFKGKGSTRRPNTKNLSTDKNLEKAEARIRYY